MCGRITLTRGDWDDVLVEVMKILEPTGVGPILGEAGASLLYRPHYNVAPTQLHPVVRSMGGQAIVGFARWGLPARGPSKPLVINARAESLARRPTFQESFANRRCLVLADGFFEWKNGPEGRQPLWFHPVDGGLLLLAGLFDPGPAPGPADSEPVPASFVVLTTAPNSLMASVHDRMPALLSASEAASWLAKPDSTVLHPAPDDLLVATPVSVRVNSVRHDDPACLAPPRNIQLKLFD